MTNRIEAKYSITIPSKLSELSTVESFTEKISVENGLNENEMDNLAIAVTEAVNNAIIHGNKGDKSKNVQIDFVFAKDEIIVAVKDEGNGFNPKKVKNPLAPENLLKASGRGIFILKQLMDEVGFKFESSGTTTIMKKKL